MDKLQVAGILDEIGTLLELQGESGFRCRAYHNAARSLEQLETTLADVIAQGKLRDIPGIGDTMQEKITTLVATGTHPYYEEQKKKVPAGLLEILRLPSVGPKKVKALYDELGIDDVDKLRQACQSGEVAKLKGFGVKTAQKILEGIQFLEQSGKRVRLDQALEIGQALLAGLRECPGVIRSELCGSLRRRKETINDIDILVSAGDPGPIMDRFVSLEGVTQVIVRGETKCSITVAHGAGSSRYLMNADLRVVSDEQFPFALHYFTGSKEHNIALRARAQSYGLKLNEYELARAKGAVKCKDEDAIFRTLDLDAIAPELRENTGEVDAAAEHRLPALIQPEDIQGVFHCHTDWSDGTATLEEMAKAARSLGLKYLGIADHSQSLAFANGLTPERVRKQIAEIDALNRKLKGIHLFKGTECDILADGRLDFDDEVLGLFDYVVASVHALFNMPEAEMTERIVRAVSHPKVTMLGHATGRLLLRRDGYKVDLEAVLQAAAKHGTMIEINAHPQRLDLDWVHCKRAKTLGVQLVINPDAHATGEIALFHFGVSVARRGWLEKKDVFNTQSLEQVTRALADKRARN
jgi:DNA polymerase (family 10)